ncbi:hypothetical protein [Streptomyces sp. NPDC094049]|uniref:hypothetical protein n=1 Tax=Streptomyces sp. NPDC094049 TaxID=3154987 RepID=UPI00332AB7AF
MTQPTIVVALLALALGYLLGRLRLGHRASDWAHWLTYRRTPITRREWRWWAAQPVFAVEIAYLITTRPRRTWQAWITRNDPPPPRGPAPQLRRIGDPR